MFQPGKVLGDSTEDLDIVVGRSMAMVTSHSQPGIVPHVQVCIIYPL